MEFFEKEIFASIFQQTISSQNWLNFAAVWSLLGFCLGKYKNQASSKSFFAKIESASEENKRQLKNSQP